MVERVRVSAVDHPELVLLAKVTHSAVCVQEDLVERHPEVYTEDNEALSPLQAAVAICQRAPANVLGDDRSAQAMVLQWLEFAYTVVKPALQSSPEPHVVAMVPLQEALKTTAFLCCKGPSPLACDWLLWAMLATRIAALTPAAATQKYFRLVRWAEHLRCLSADVLGRDSVKPFDMAALQTALPTAAAAANEPAKEKGQGDKKQKAQKQQAPKPATDASLQLDPAARVDIRVGKIVDVVKHPNADRLYIEQVDLGEPQLRTVVSGLVEFVPMEQLQDRLCCFLCNLKPAAMCKTVSQAMILVGKNEQQELQLLTPPEGSKPGDRVSVEGIEAQPDEQLKSKEAIWPAVQDKLRVVDGHVVYTATQGGRLATHLGLVTVQLDSGNIS